MLSMRKRLIIIGVMIIAVIALITTIFACSNKWDDGYSFGGGKDKHKNPYACTVTFDMGYGTMIGVGTKYSVEIEKNTTLARPSEIPQRYGYMFWGWNTTGREDDPMWKFDVEKITQDMTIYAVWVKTYTVTFYADEGTFDDGDDMRTVTVVNGDKLTEPKLTPTDVNKELQGWYFGSETWNFSQDVVTRDITLTAVWDLKRDIQRALEPFRYNKTDDGYTVYGVVDQNVSELTVPSIITSISHAAFSNCHNLVSVIIPDSVTEIGEFSFQNCEKLKSVTLPSGLTGIEQYTFDGCAALEDIRLPDTLTEVGEYAFRGCSSLKSIEIPSSVTEIKNDTLKDCTSLRQVKLGDNVTKIGSRAFSGCTALDDIQIPAALEVLGSSAFEGCSSLKSIIIPATCNNNVSSLSGSSIFEDCTGLISAELHCETVGQSAFRGCTALTDVTFGAEVRSIKTAAFMKCTALTEIDIPDGVTTLEPAFIDCADLCSVTIGDGVKQLNSNMFLRCNSLRSVAIGDGIDTLYANTFQNNYNLRSVTIGSGVKTIKAKAFYFSTSLLNIIIPSSVETIEQDAFYGCYKLAEVYNLSQASYTFGPSVKVHTDASEASVLHYTDDGFTFRVYNSGAATLLDYWGGDEDIVLPDSYNGESYKIDRYAFAYNPRVKSVKFSAGVKEIGGEILLGSDNVTSLTVDSGNTEYHAAGNCVIKTSDKMFILGCKTSVIPDDGSVTSIGSNVFCRNATIVNDAFVIPDTVTSVGYNAFDGCNGITRNVGYIQYVDKWAVGLLYYGGNENIDLQFESGTVGIADEFFNSSNSIRNYLQSVKFNDELKYIGGWAFWQCVKLTTVTFNDGLVSIGAFAFTGCEKLQQVTLPDSVSTIEWSAFSNCKALTYVKLPTGLTLVNSQIFLGCLALEEVVVPQSVQRIRYYMLYGCPDTVKVYYCGSEQQWNKIMLEANNTELINATKYFYSETEIEGVNCWHYDADGKPTTEY